MNIIAFAYPALTLEISKFISKISNITKRTFGRIPPMKRIGILIERQRAYGRSICLGISRFAQEHADWSMRMLEWADADNPRRLHEFDGFIVRILNDRLARTFLNTGKPVVDVFHEREWPGVSSVDQHARIIGQVAARHFIEHKFTRFAFCGFNGRSYSDKRCASFTRCLQLNHFDCSVYDSPPSAISDFDNTIIRQERLSFGTDNRRLEKWIRALPKPVAVFCCDDFRASETVRLCKRLGIRIPDEVAILGVDDDPVYCMFSSPRLSSIDPDARALGLAAARMLYGRISSRKGNKASAVTIPPKGIVVRASTDAYQGAPSWFADALAFIGSETSRGISASDVFRHVGFSRTLVEKTFRKVLGKTVQEQIVEVRIQSAKRLLLTTALPIKDVAAQSGFSSTEYFTRSFASATGRPPGAFRRQ